MQGYSGKNKINFWYLKRLGIFKIDPGRNQ